MAITDELLDRVRLIESGDGRFLRSPAGALGPYQFMPATAREYGVADPMDERQSREGARRYLTDLYKQFGSVEAALTAYNWGPGNVAEYLSSGRGVKGQDMPAEAREYAPKVLGAKVSAGKDRSADLFGESAPARAAQDFSAELFGDERPKQSKPGAMLPAKDAPEPPRRGMVAELGRQVALSARAPLDAVANLVAIPGNAVTSVYNLATGRNVPSAGETYRGWIDSVLPKPETDVERFSNVVASSGYGVALPAAVAGAAQPASAVGRGVQTALTQNVGSQIAGAATGSGTTELLTQGGADPVLAGAIGLGAGMAGGRLYQAGENLATRVGTQPQAVQARAARMAENAGVDFTKLPANVRAEFERTVREAARNNTPMDDAQVARWLQLKAAGVQNPTRAMVTRNAQDWAEEDRLMRLSGIGDPLRTRYESAQEAVRSNFRPEVMPGDTKTGGVVRGALREVAGGLREQRNQAYTAARNAPEVRQGVPVDGLRQWLNTTESRWTLQPEYKATLDELRRLAGDRPSITQGNHEELRQFVNSLRRPDASNAGVIRDIKSRVDNALLSAGKTPVFRDARDINTIYKATTADQGFVARLLEMRSPTDPRVWDSQVFDEVMRAQPNQIKQLKNTLDVGGKSSAWGTLKERVKEELATTLNQSPTTDDRAASLVRLFDNKREQLAVIFSKAEFEQLKNARDAAVLVMQKVGGAPTNPSGTAGNIVEYLRKAGVVAGPMARAANMATGGLLGAAMDAGRQSIANRADLARVSAAMNPGLLSGGPAAALPTPILTPGLLGAIYGAQQAASESR
jgi:hypothetical protein